MNITHAQFEKCLADKEKLKVSASHIRQKNHTLKTVQELKMALSSYDSKRWIYPDGIYTLAYGHFLLKSNNIDI